MTIPTDNVDEEQLQRPAHWDTAFIRRFMTLLRPDQLDLRLRDLRDHDLGLQRRTRRCSDPAGSSSRSRPRASIIFAIRTRRVPFFHSTPSTPLTVATLSCVAIGVLLPFSPLAHVLGFIALPAGFLGDPRGDDRHLLRADRARQAALLPRAAERAADRASPPRARTLDPSPRHALDHPGRPAARGSVAPPCKHGARLYSASRPSLVACVVLRRAGVAAAR